METTATKTIDEAIAEYCERLTAAYKAQFSGEYQNKLTIKHEPSAGKIYTRIERTEIWNETGNVTGRSAVAFVKRDDGSIWKPAGWKGPAKNFSRGNVYNLGDFVAWSL